MPSKPAVASKQSKIKSRLRQHKKILLIVLLIALIGGGLYLAEQLSSTPKYDTLKEVSVTGTAAEGDGLTVQIPAEMEETANSDAGVEYVHYQNPETKDVNWIYSEMAAVSQSLPPGETLTTERLVEAADSLKNVSIEDFSGALDDERYKNLSLKDSSATDDNRIVTLNFTFDYVTSETSTIPGRGRVVFYLQDHALYWVIIAATNAVYDKNSQVFDEVFSSVKLNQ